MAIITYSFTIIDYAGPFLANLSPDASETGTDGNIDPIINILDEYSGVNINSIQVKINNNIAFQGPNTFYSPWNSPNASIVTTTIDGYDGYKLTLGNTETLSANTLYTVIVIAEDNDGSLINDNISNPIPNTYTFRTGNNYTISVGNYENNIIVNFANPMNIDSELVSSGNYKFSNGMYARLVEFINATSVLLWVEKFDSNDIFTMSTQNIIDGYGDTIPNSYNSASISPFKADANITNYNALIKTWHESNIIQADSQRIYLAGTRGIDIFRKLTDVSITRWAQIFDSYGAKAMFVANFGGELEITDTTAPFLQNQVPSPNSSMTPVDLIVFTIADADTAPNIEQTIIYVDGNIIFAGGYGGWNVNYSGIISVGYKELTFAIRSFNAFNIGDTISIRVVSADLLGNELDTTYNAVIASSALGYGFGAASWGITKFGGVT